MNYDVFNGDADGICALHQLRLAEPRQAILVSGVKRDIRLLEKLADNPGVEGAEITVLDISLESNKDSLGTLLQRRNNIFYVDHHFAGEIPAAENLRAIIDPSPEVCTGLLIDRLLSGKFRLWAIVAAYGDNLHVAARQTAAGLGLTDKELATLQELGDLMNYNGYGRALADLHVTPQELYLALTPFASPFDFYRESGVPCRLQNGYAEDMARARSVQPLAENDTGRIFTFPEAPWSRRVAGVFSNEKAREMEGKAHALIVDNGDGTLLVSVRAPLINKQGAVSLCRKFPTGGGREAAAGINALPQEQLDGFVEAFRQTW
ncbi:MAG: acetyltransferase [Proteobacteria bacterium]|nr:acetyltransferase [Pseudomonadota bacterium]MBU4296848.1 acetyltransferase [Pseudomonadota bacterium]MCG2748972.1 acetyltransferase [Desulfobulbaceae bacterium]